MRRVSQLFFLFFIVVTHGLSQNNRVLSIFPPGTILHGNVTNRSYYTFIAGPAVGGLYYTNLVWEPQF